MTDGHLSSGVARRLSLAGALLACVGFAVPAAADTATAAPAAGFDVLQLNVCHSGSAECPSTGNAVESGIAAVRERAPRIVTINEVCAHDVTKMTRETGYHAEFTPARAADGAPAACTDGRGDYGIAVLAHPDLGAVSGAVTEQVFTAQDGTGQQRVALCAPFSSFAACTSQLSAADPQVAAQQCAELSEVAAGLGRPTVLGGDLNLRHGAAPDVQDCVPSGWVRTGDGSVQHVFNSADFAFERTENLPLDGTDYPGLVVELSH